MPNYTDITLSEWRDPLIRYCLSRQLSLVDAEDVAQEALTRFLASPELITYPERWLIRVARNAIIDQFRHPSPEPLGHLSVSLDRYPPFSDEPSFDIVEMADLCNGLTKNNLQICRLSFVFGLGDEDAAFLMGISRETAKKRRQRLAAKMRAQCMR